MKKSFLLVLLTVVFTFVFSAILIACETQTSPTHTLTHVEAKDATCTEDGNIEHWVCLDCGKYFSDENATAEISQSVTVVPAKGHTFSEDWSGDETYHWHVCLNCNEVSDKAEHSWNDSVCSVCEIPKPSEGLAYKLNNSRTAYSVTGIGTCTDTEVIIPSVYNSLPVTSVAESAFKNCSSLTSVTIPGSVTSIGKSAFGHCNSLKSVTIASGVISIEESAFSSCLSLTCINISDSVTSIGGNAFYNCTSLKSIYITDMTSWCNISFGKDFANPLYYAKNLYLNGKLLTELVIPDDVNNIGNYAFEYCESLTSVTIPNSVTSINSYAFNNCTSLKSVTIGNDIISIGDYAFNSCTSLSSITIPDSVTSIGDYAFNSCTSLSSITVPDSVTSIGDYAFSSCTSFSSITIPDSVTSIGYSAFA